MTHQPHRPPSTAAHHELAAHRRGSVVVIDDDVDVLSSLCALLSLEGYAVQAYPSAESCLEALKNPTPAVTGPRCVLCDVNLPGQSGLELQQHLARLDATPIILMSGVCGTREAAQGFRAGALDFLTKPFEARDLLGCVARALHTSAERQARAARHAEIAQRINRLTPQELEVARRVVKGEPNQSIADNLGIALRTAKLHRSRAMQKLQLSSVVDLVRVADEFGL